MRYIVRATKMYEYDRNTTPFYYTVYDGTDFKNAKAKMNEYICFGGVSFESRENE